MLEDEIRLVLDDYKSSFITHDILPGIYTFKGFSDVLLRYLQFEFDGDDNAINIEFDHTTMKTKLDVKPGNLARRFDAKSFFSSILSFNPHWDYKHYNEYISQKYLNLSTINKIHIKCDFNDSSVVNAVREIILFSFILNLSAGYKVFCGPETIFL